MSQLKAIAIATAIAASFSLGALTTAAHAATPTPTTPTPTPTPTTPAASTTTAAASYVPTSADFIGKWKLYGATVRAPADARKPAPAKKTAEARGALRTLVSFYQAFDYLEISADGRYNFHQPGESADGGCVWCGKWSFHDESLWLDLPTAPRLDIYATDGKMQMTYDAETSDTSLFRWMVVGWAKDERAVAEKPAQP